MNKYILWLIKFAIPILGFGLAIWSTFFLGEDRQVAYEVVSTTEIGSLKSEHLSDLQISYGGVSIEHGGIITIKITNTGDAPIYSKEFDGPIEISLDAKSQFVDAKVINTTPDNLKPLLSLSNGVIHIKPLLLNSNDRITIQAIAKGSINNIRITGRIGGISELVDMNKSKKTLLYGFSWLLIVYAVLCFISYSLVGPVLIGKSEDLKSRPVSQWGAMLIVVTVIISGIIALNYFVDMHGLENNWMLLIYLFGLILIAEILAIPLRPKKANNENH